MNRSAPRSKSMLVARAAPHAPQALESGAALAAH
jgi:hypothetical protein